MNNKKKLIILIGTMTGNAELVADDIVDHCSKENIETKIYEMDNIKPEKIKNLVDPILICTSTYGQGDVPDNAKALYNFLNKKKPNLNNIKYTIFGLGDKTYKETFSFGGKRFDKVFSSLGAQRIGKPFFHDASSGSLPEEDGVKWFKNNIKILL